MNKLADSFLTKEYELYIGKNSQHYTGYLVKLRNGRKISWNWPAFLFCEYWLIYRKLYKQFLFVWGLYMGASISQDFRVYLFFAFLIRIYVGIYGNYWVMVKTRDSIKNLRIEFEERSNQYFSKIQNVGDVNKKGLSVFILVTLILAIFFLY